MGCITVPAAGSEHSYVDLCEMQRRLYPWDNSGLSLFWCLRPGYYTLSQCLHS
jgi:hypothetical protein